MIEQRPGCGPRCREVWHDPDAHEAYGQSRVARGIVRSGPLVIDLSQPAVWVDGQEVLLTGRELAVLCCLARQAGRWILTDALIDEVWGSDSADPGDHRTQAGRMVRFDRQNLDAVVYGLRRRLGSAGHLVQSLGRGRMMRRRLEHVPPSLPARGEGGI